MVIHIIYIYTTAAFENANSGQIPMEPLPRQVGVFLACAAGRSPMLYVQPRKDSQGTGKHNNWLVVDVHLCKNMKVSWDDYSQYMGK